MKKKNEMDLQLEKNRRNAQEVAWRSLEKLEAKGKFFFLEKKITKANPKFGMGSCLYRKKKGVGKGRSDLSFPAYFSFSKSSISSSIL